MTVRLTPARWAGLVVIVMGLAAGLVVYSEHAGRRLAEEAVRNVAGEAGVLRLVETSWPGRRTSLWCGAVRRPDGLVAVTIRRSRLPVLQKVTEVAPAWVEARSSTERLMLEKCGRQVR